MLNRRETVSLSANKSHCHYLIYIHHHERGHGHDRGRHGHGLWIHDCVHGRCDRGHHDHHGHRAHHDHDPARKKSREGWRFKNKNTPNQPSWWFQPIWKLAELDHVPQIFGMNINKIFDSNHHQTVNRPSNSSNPKKNHPQICPSKAVQDHDYCDHHLWEKNTRRSSWSHSWIFPGGKKRVDSEKYYGEVGQGDDIYKLMKHHFMN